MSGSRSDSSKLSDTSDADENKKPRPTSFRPAASRSDSNGRKTPFLFGRESRLDRSLDLQAPAARKTPAPVVAPTPAPTPAAAEPAPPVDLFAKFLEIKEPKVDRFAGYLRSPLTEKATRVATPVTTRTAPAPLPGFHVKGGTFQRRRPGGR